MVAYSKLGWLPNPPIVGLEGLAPEIEPGVAEGELSKEKCSQPPPWATARTTPRQVVVSVPTPSRRQVPSVTCMSLVCLNV